MFFPLLRFYNAKVVPRGATTSPTYLPSSLDSKDHFGSTSILAIVYHFSYFVTLEWVSV